MMHFRIFLPNGAVSSSIIIIGQIGSLLVNLVVNLLFLAGLLVKKWRRPCAPVWLPWANLLILAVQIYYELFFEA